MQIKQQGSDYLTVASDEAMVTLAIMLGASEDSTLVRRWVDSPHQTRCPDAAGWCEVVEGDYVQSCLYNDGVLYAVVEWGKADVVARLPGGHLLIGEFANDGLTFAGWRKVP